MSQNRNSRPNKRTNRRNPNSPKRIDLSKRPNRTGRTGRSAQGSNRPAHKEHGLGGEQIEGLKAGRDPLLGARRRIHEIWIANDIEFSPVIDDIIEIARDQRIQVMNVSRREIEREARSEAPQGVLAKAASLEETLLADLLNAPRDKALLLVAIDGVTDPGNLGAILRCCDGAGVDAVILPRHRAVHITPTVAKAAAGAIEYLNMCVVGGLPSALSEMKSAGVVIVGLDDSAQKSIFELGVIATDSICVVLGAEGPGLSRLVRERCDSLANIPMLGSLSSLNVSVAAALATYEIVRTRSVTE
ncbi:MAG: 23S rRNA (guanosine(2251)-2'-O)-methyltransferase RlmB [Actinobacteria bacterium]|nr:MAG: 23S rRNA (guanosine(2251)-2'-O)-methyltransferase RlmB [Actinomycetota bacterium]